MRNCFLLLTAMISIVPLVCESQVIGQTRSDTLQYQISYTNHCLNKYRVQNLYGIASQFIGGSIIAVFNIPELNGMSKIESQYNSEIALAGDALDKQLTALREYQRDQDKINDRKKGSLVMGGVFVLVGTYLQIDSYKWLKRAYLKPGEIGITIEF